MTIDLAAFIGVSALIIMTPGQDTALVIRHALFGGRKNGVYAALGVAAGQALWALATSAGLAALLRASEPLFALVKLVGALYLVFLGMQAMRDALHPRETRDKATADGFASRVAPVVAFRHGMLSNLGNPKMAVFFTSLLPQFTPRGEAPFLTLLPLGLIFSMLTLAWLTGYAIAIARVGHFMRRRGIRRALEGLVGAVLIALGLRLAAEHR